MKLVDLTCPKCGASIKVNEELTKCACNYCGAEFQIEKEISLSQITNGKELGYQQWQGSKEAEKNQVEEIIEKLSKAITPVKELENSYIEYKELEERIKTGVPVNMTGMVSIGGGLIAGSIIALIVAKVWEFSGTSSLLLWVGLSIAMVLLFKISGDLMYSNKQEEYKFLKQKCDEKKKEYLDLVNKYSSIVKVVPPDYRYSDAVESFYKYFKNNRAGDMKQAVNLYEEEMHRLRLENIQQATLIENRKQTALQAETLAMTILKK